MTVSTAHQVIHDAVGRRAVERPEAVAIVDENGSTTFSTLVAAADTYAAELSSLGVRAGTTVPVRLPRSAQFVALLLAILKIGASYSAMDPRWPTQRVRSILARLRADLFVTATEDAGWEPVRRWTPPAETPGRAAARRLAAPPVRVSGTDPACVFFTSGSTGTPKGVITPHRAVTRLVDGGPLAALGPGRVMPQVAPVAWDACGFELWGNLTRGGTVVFLDEDEHLLPDTLRDLVTDRGVNTLTLVGSLFNLLVSADIDCFAGIDLVLIGGERLAPNPVRRFLARYPDTALFSCYGPVESCAFTTMHRIRPEDCARPHGIPLGRPVPGTAVHVRDGEICIAGDGLALGYLGDPAATRERFATVDLDGVPTRLYRTGDLGRLDPDGVLHFLGRADRQVKIRGYRIELAEVENLARAVPGVLDCAAVPLAGADSAYHRLALAYALEDGDGGGGDPLGLRALLRQRVPAHLVPDVVRHVGTLPRNDNGKVDYTALTSQFAHHSGR